MIESDMVELDGFNMGQVDDNCWGFTPYEYDTFTFEDEENEN